MIVLGSQPSWSKCPHVEKLDGRDSARLMLVKTYFLEGNYVLLEFSAKQIQT